MVPSGGHKEDDLALIEDGCDDSDVRQVTAAGQLGIITNQNIALLDALMLAGALRVVPQLHKHSQLVVIIHAFMLAGPLCEVPQLHRQSQLVVIIHACMLAGSLCV